MKAPDKINPRCLADYLEVITHAVFQAGLPWRVTEVKWPNLREAFHQFDPERVAEIGPGELEEICRNPGVIRNRAKIEATISNAAKLVEFDQTEQGGINGWLGSHGDFDATRKALRNNFRFVGDTSAYYVLWVLNEPVPDFDTWSRQRGWPTKQQGDKR